VTGIGAAETQQRGKGNDQTPSAQHLDDDDFTLGFGRMIDFKNKPRQLNEWSYQNEEDRP
jgi:hypothetical protein